MNGRTDKHQVGEICVVVLPDTTLDGAKIKILRNDGNNYWCELCPGFEMRWSSQQFYLDDTALADVPIPATPEEIEEARETLLQTVRELT